MRSHAWRHALLYCLLPAVLIELVSRVAWVTIENSGRLSNGIFAVRKLIDQPWERQSLVSHPYMLFWNRPDFSAMGFRQTNSLGYRNAYEPAPRKGLRILALGGSTTYSFPFVPDPGKIWTALVESELRRSRPGELVELLNAGAPYATSAELLAHYVFRGQHLEPDLIIFHEGGNDVAPLMFDGYSPEYLHFRESSNLQARPFEAPLLRTFYSLRLPYAIWLARFPAIYIPQPMPFDKISRAAANARVHANESPAFRRNLDTLIRLAESRGARVLMIGFLQARRERLAIGMPQYAGLEDAVIEGVAKHDRIMMELASRHPGTAIFAKLDQGRFADSWFIDNCHLTEEGEREKARQIGAWVARLLAR
jgi:lysophospholipase L1-like esterase